MGLASLQDHGVGEHGTVPAAHEDAGVRRHNRSGVARALAQEFPADARHAAGEKSSSAGGVLLTTTMHTGIFSDDDGPEPFGDGATLWLSTPYRSVSDLLIRATDKPASAEDKAA